MFRSKARLDIYTHQKIAKRIKNDIYNLIYEKYNHNTAQYVVNYVFNVVKDKFNKDDRLVKLLLRMKQCKRRIRRESFVNLLSYLDDDYNSTITDEEYLKYGYIYYK